MDPLSQVYSGRDNSGAATIFNGRPDATSVLIKLQDNDRARMVKAKAIQDALAAKQVKPGDIPIPQGAPSDMAYFTKRRADIVAKMKPLYDNTLPAEKRAELEQEINMDKGAMMIEAYKSAKDHADLQSQYADFREHPWSYAPNTEEQMKSHYDTPVDKRQPLNLKRLDESDFRGAIQGVAVDHGKIGKDIPMPDGTINHVDQNVWSEPNVRKAYDTWKQNTNLPVVKSFYHKIQDEAAQLYAKDAGLDFNNLTSDQKQVVRDHVDAKKLDEIGYAFFKNVKQSQFASDVQQRSRKDDDYTKAFGYGQKKLAEMKDIQYDNTYNTDPKGGFGGSAPSISYTIVQPAKSAANIRLTNKMFDADKKTPIGDVGTVKFTPGQIIVGEKLKSDKSKVWTPLVSGTYFTTEVNQGNKVSVPHHILVPLKEMEGSLDKNGEQYQWAYELADQKNFESLTPAKKGKKYDYSNINN